MKLIIRDFQSLEEVKINVEGLTLLVGESGAGKSSVRRALQAALFNRFKGGQVRFGQDHSTIKVMFEDDGPVLQVQRSWSGGSPITKLGDKTFSKQNRNVPKEVAEFVNFGNLELGGDTYSCNIHPQFQKPLLLEFSQQRVMELLSASSALDDLKEAKEVVAQDRQRVKGAIQSVDQMLETITDQVNKGKKQLVKIHEVVDVLVPKLDEAEGINEKLEAIEIYKKAYSILLKLAALEELVLKISKVCDSLIKLSSMEDQLMHCYNLLVSINHLHALESAIINIKPRLSASQVLDQVVDLKRLVWSLESLNKEEESLEQKLTVCKARYELENSMRADLQNRQGISALKTLVETLKAIEQEEKALVDVVENHICPVCGNKVS